MRERVKQLMAAVIRRRRPVAFGDVSQRAPVSSMFGLERGTPIDRYYVERFLAANRRAITGDVLEVGSPAYTRRFGTNVASSAVLHAEGGNDAATFVGDLTSTATLPASRFDCFVCTQTLGFIFDVNAAVAGIRYMLRPNGMALVTVAGISQISRYDMDRWGDYWRFTTRSLSELFARGFTDVRVSTHGNVSAAIALLQGLAVEDLPDANVLDAVDENYQVILTVSARAAG